MNWVGGARNRVKFQGDRRLQKEFFERKKLDLKREHLQKPSHHKKRKKKLSQDLVALQTVNSASSAKVGSSPRRGPNVQRVDLDHRRLGLWDRRGELYAVPRGLGTRSAIPRRPGRVELPFSPDHHPSRLHLIESQTPSFSSATTSGHAEHHVGHEDITNPFVLHSKTKPSSSQPSPSTTLLVHDERQQPAEPFPDTSFSSTSQKYFGSGSLLEVGLLPSAKYRGIQTSRFAAKSHQQDTHPQTFRDTRPIKNPWSPPLEHRQAQIRIDTPQVQIYDSQVSQAYRRPSHTCSLPVDFSKSQFRTSTDQNTEVENPFTVCAQTPQTQRLHKAKLLRKNIWLRDDTEKPTESRVDPHANLSEWSRLSPAMSVTHSVTHSQRNTSPRARETEDCQLLAEGKSRKRQVSPSLLPAEPSVYGRSKATPKTTDTFEVLDSRGVPENRSVKRPSPCGSPRLRQLFSSSCKDYIQSRFAAQEEQSKLNDLWLPEDFQPSPASSCGRRLQNDQTPLSRSSSLSGGFHRSNISKWNCFQGCTDESQTSSNCLRPHRIKHTPSPSIYKRGELEDNTVILNSHNFARVMDRNMSSPVAPRFESRPKSKTFSEDAHIDIKKESSVLGDSRMVSLLQPFSETQSIVPQQSSTSHTDVSYRKHADSAHSWKRQCIYSQGNLEPLGDSTQRLDSGYNEDERERRMPSTPCIGLSTSTSSSTTSLPKLPSPRLRPKKQNQAEETLRELEELEGQIEGNAHSGQTRFTNQGRRPQDSFLQPGSTYHTPTNCHQPGTNGRAEVPMHVDAGDVIDNVLQQEPHDLEANVRSVIDNSGPAVKETHQESVRKMSETTFREQTDEPNDEPTKIVSRTCTAPRDEAIPQNLSQQSPNDGDNDTGSVFEYKKTACDSLTGEQPGKTKNDEPLRTAEMTIEDEHNGCLRTKKDCWNGRITNIPQDTSRELVQPAGLATVVSTMVQTDWSLTAHGGSWTSGKNTLDKSVQWETPPSSQTPATSTVQRTTSPLSQQSSGTTATPSFLEQRASTSNLTSKRKLLVIRKSPKKPLPPLQEYKREPKSTSLPEYSAGSASELSQQKETMGMSTHTSCQRKARLPSSLHLPALSKQHPTAQFVSPLRQCTPTPCYSSSQHQDKTTSPSKRVKIILRSTSFTQHETTLILSPSHRHSKTPNCPQFPHEETVFASYSSKCHLATPQSFSSEQHEIMSNSPSSGRRKATSCFSLSEQLETAPNYTPSPPPTATFRSSSHHTYDRKTASPAVYCESTPHSSSSQQHEAKSNASPSHYHVTKSCSPSSQSFQQHTVLTSFPYGPKKTRTPCQCSHYKQKSADWTSTPQRLKSPLQSAIYDQHRVTPESHASQKRIAVSSNSLSPSEQHYDFPRIRCESAVGKDPRESGRNSYALNTFKLFQTWEEAKNPSVFQKDAQLPVYSVSGQSAQHRKRSDITSHHPREIAVEPLSPKLDNRCTTGTRTSSADNRHPETCNIQPVQEGDSSLFTAL